MFQAAGGVDGLVLEVKGDVGEAGHVQPQQMGIGRACGLLFQQGEGIADPAAVGGGIEVG